MQKKTFVLGASLKTNRYSNKAVNLLVSHNITTVAFGLRNGFVSGVEIETKLTNYEDIHTLTLYLNPKRQIDFYDYILSLDPKRVIFNPGTENAELMLMLDEQGIIYETACTLVLLSTNQY